MKNSHESPHFSTGPRVVSEKVLNLDMFVFRFGLLAGQNHAKRG